MKYTKTVIIMIAYEVTDGPMLIIPIISTIKIGTM